MPVLSPLQYPAELSEVMAGLGADKERALEAQRVQLESELLRVAGAGEAEVARLEEALRRDFQTITHTQQQAHLKGANPVELALASGQSSSLPAFAIC
jgi:hypothetical protein